MDSNIVGGHRLNGCEEVIVRTELFDGSPRVAFDSKRHRVYLVVPQVGASLEVSSHRKRSDADQAATQLRADIARFEKGDPAYALMPTTFEPTSGWAAQGPTNTVSYRNRVARARLTKTATQRLHPITLFSRIFVAPTTGAALWFLTTVPVVSSGALLAAFGMGIFATSDFLRSRIEREFSFARDEPLDIRRTSRGLFGIFQLGECLTDGLSYDDAMSAVAASSVASTDQVTETESAGS